MKTKILCIKKLFFMFLIIAPLCLLLNLTFAMPASAYDITTPVEPTGRSWSQNAYWWATWHMESANSYRPITAYSKGIFINKAGLNDSNPGNYIVNAIQIPNIQAEYGKYYKFDVKFTFQNGISRETYPVVVAMTTDAQPAYKIMAITNDYVPCADNVSQITANQELWGMCSWGGITYTIIVQARDSGTIPIQIGLSNTDMFRFRIDQWQPSQGSTNVGTISVSDVQEFKTVQFGENVANDINNQQEQAGEQAQQEGNTAGNQAGEQAQQETATMFQTIGNILGAITDTPPGDCTITGNMGNLNMGNLNLCVAEIEPIRPIIRAVIYLVMALATYKILMWVIGAIAGLINWVQTGNEGKEENG